MNADLSRRHPAGREEDSLPCRSPNGNCLRAATSSTRSD